jgi:hypothetical protein
MNAHAPAQDLALRPVTRAEGDEFVRAHHRHHGVPVGALWRHGVHDFDGSLVGVAVVGRPVARALDDGLTVEITRLCTIGHPNACSMLYAAARRAADAKGYRRGLTYTLASEWDRFEGNRRIGGRSLIAAGYRFLWRVDGRSWNCKSRPRVDNHPTEDKVAFGWGEWGRLEQVAEASGP